MGGGTRNLSPETRAALSAAGRLGAVKGAAQRRREKDEGMAFAREWRERNRGVDWSLPDG